MGGTVARGGNGARGASGAPAAAPPPVPADRRLRATGDPPQRRSLAADARAPGEVT